MMKKIIFAFSLVFASLGFCQEMLTLEVPKIVVTNLNDKLRTQVTIDNSTGIDIRRLNLDSIHADKHKSRYTTVKNMSIDVPSTRRVVMVTPLSARDKDGKSIRVDNTYIDSHAVRKFDTKNILIDNLSVKNIFINDLSPSIFYLDEGRLNIIGSKGKSSPFGIKSLRPYTINATGYGTTDSTVSSITLDSGSANRIGITKLNLSPMEVKRLEANLLAVKKLQPTIINVTDASSISSIMAIDNSRFNVVITEDTYAELAEMKLIYNFENDYNESMKTEVKLNDVRKLDRKMYIKWIKILAANKKCNIAYIKNKKPRKIIGEAWLYDNRYNI